MPTELTRLVPSSAGEVSVIFSSKKATYWGTVSNVLKALVGTGILALGPAIKSSGWLLGGALSCLMSVLALYTMRIVLLCIQRLRRDGLNQAIDGRIQYVEVAQAAFGGYGKAAASFSVVTCQLGSCMAYLAFASSNITAVLLGTLRRWQVTVALSLLVAPLCALRTTRPLSFTSSLGNMALAVGMLSIFGFGLAGATTDQLRRHAESMPAADWSGFSLLFGVSLFMFSAHTEMIPIEQDAKRRASFLTLLNWVFVGITCLYLSFGLMVVIIFGPHTGERFDAHTHTYIPGTIFDNLVAEGGSRSAYAFAVISLVRVLMAVTLMVQYPISLLPCSKNLELLLGLDSMSSDPKVTLVRVLEVALICAFVIAVPGFEIITALTGSATGGLIAFVLPPLFYHKICSDEMSSQQKALNYLVFAVGTLGSLYATVVVCM
jgi:amino acid permease